MNKTTKINLYETDFLEWIDNTATLLKDKRFDLLDLENLIEEIESMGKSQKNEAMNRLTTIIEHLLKIVYWESERDYNLRGWKQTVITQRSKLYRLLKNSPSLKRYLEDNWLECYEQALKNFKLISGITVTDRHIFSLTEILEEEFFANY